MKLHKGLIKGSLILLIAFNIYNLFNFLFQFAIIPEHGNIRRCTL